MQTTDCTGAYDYEKEEAQHEAQTMLADLAEGYYTPEQFEAAKARTLAHWAAALHDNGNPNSFAEFKAEFEKIING